MTKQISYEDFLALAAEYSIKPANACAIMLQESKAASFDSQSRPYILFERHIFYRQVKEAKGQAEADRIARLNPTICNASPTPKGGYGGHNEQWDKFAIASTFNRPAAIEACSWGLGQVLGKYWKALGYASAQDMLNGMFSGELGQVKAIFGYLKFTNLIPALNRGDVVAIAKGYNGVNYKMNNYDGSLKVHLDKCTALFVVGKLNTLEVFKG